MWPDRELGAALPAVPSVVWSAEEGFLTAPTPAAAWFPDPLDATRQRWWDGTKWTDHLHVPEPVPVPALLPAYASFPPPAAATVVSAPAAVAAEPSLPAEEPAQLRPRGADRVAAPPPKGKSKLYWSNLLSFRQYWFTLASTLVIAFVVTLIIPPVGPVMILLAPLIFWAFLHVQMRCHHCGSALNTSKVGGVEVCKRCQQPTDAGLAAGRG
ncbi:hypothetical protein ASF30_11325 [Leifsonia sp. Leaf264]|nr:hypothetical protein ASF30_11325 [Leifsonia sp. Leaf264]